VRQLRRVPKDWQHPRYTIEDAPDPSEVGEYKPLIDGRQLARDLQKWDEGAAQWDRGFVRAELPTERWRPRGEEEYGTYADYEGERPKPDDYTPDWPESQRTHWMLYYVTTGGTPLSPAFPSAEQLARWLSDHHESVFADCVPSYEQWLSILSGTGPAGCFVGQENVGVFSETGEHLEMTGTPSRT
jgi:hypothetical protein